MPRPDHDPSLICPSFPPLPPPSQSFLVLKTCKALIVHRPHNGRCLMHGAILYTAIIISFMPSSSPCLLILLLLLPLPYLSFSLAAEGGGAPPSAMGSALFFKVVLLVLGLWFGCSSAELQRIEHSAKADGSLSLLVVGDWGRKGLYNQSLVAAQMGRTGVELDIDFVVSTGDNFYSDGLAGVHDPAFDESFSNIYTARGVQKQWYSVLGNHDYRGDVLAQLSPALQKIDSRWLCMRSYVLDAEIAQFFFVDTTPFVLHYWTNPKDHHYDWRDVAPRHEYVSGLLQDLDSALKESTAKWKFVVGHHTIRSVSDHGDTDELVDLLLPVLKDNDVDLYINGHDHCLQHISSNDSPVQFLTSGGGSKAWRGEYTPTADKLRFFYDGQGFMSMEVTKREVEFAFYDIYGKVLHKWSITKDTHPFE